MRQRPLLQPLRLLLAPPLLRAMGPARVVRIGYDRRARARVSRPAFRLFRTYVHVGLSRGNFGKKQLSYLPTHLPGAASGRETYLPTSKVTAFYYLFFGLRPKTSLPIAIPQRFAACGRKTYLPTYLLTPT